MSEATDAELLKCYFEEKSEAAFAELVRRRINLVYAVARRQVGGDTQLAEDVTQRVFVDLARKASSLMNRPVLSGWLCRSAQFAATDVVRAERRRRRREEASQLMNGADYVAGESIDWEKARPVLDRVLTELNEQDRDAVALRFFEGRAFADIGATLRLTEEAARKRVDRALDKLHASLMRRGVTSTTAALAAALAQQSAAAVPAGLVANVTGAALAGVAASGTTGAIAIFMGFTKTQLALVSAVMVVGAGGWTLQRESNARLATEVNALKQAVGSSETLQNNSSTAAAQAKTMSESNGAELEQLSQHAAALKERLARDSQGPGAPGGDAKRTHAAIYDLSELDRVPTPKFRAPPTYPFSERKAGTEGKVIVEFLLDANGDVVEAKATKATNEAFAESAVAALKKWKFEPGQKGGVPVGVRMSQPITYTLEKNAPPPPNWF